MNSQSTNVQIIIASVSRPAIGAAKKLCTFFWMDIFFVAHMLIAIVK